ncbi:MAG: ribonuclease R [Lachnospiraceae bacterium]|nr:ribonuclease R [Lachnospiraceae bacterium]
MQALFFINISLREKYNRSESKMKNFKITLKKEKEDRNKKSEEVKLVPAVFRATSKGFGFAAVLDENGEPGDEIFIPAQDKKTAWNNDTVIVRITKEKAADRKAEGVIEKIEKRNTEYIIGTFVKSKNFGFVVPDDRGMEEDIFIQKEHTKGAVDGHKVYVRITDYGTKKKNPEGRVVEILGHIDDPHTDMKSVLRAFNIYPEFSMEVADETDNIPSEVTEEDKKGRVSYENDLIVTIDGADAKDLDDAVSVVRTDNGYRLSVHIADVSDYVKENSPLDKSALDRGTSVYLINKVVPMLPHKLSNGICSLNQGEERLALSCIMDIDENGKIIGHKITESVIKVTRRMTYDAVAEILDVFGGDSNNNENRREELNKEYEELIPMFLLMKELSDKLRENRMQRGAVDFDFSDSKVILDEKDAPVFVGPEERNDASKIIEDFMLAANETVAEDFFWQEIPFLYRVHETPDEEKINKLLIFIKNYGLLLKGNKAEIHPKEIQKMLSSIKGREEEALISRLTLRSMRQAHYSPECEGHFGLACKYYCHFTSPIRRYPDLQIHRIIKENLNGRLDENRKMHYNKILDNVAKMTSAAERNAESAEREIVRMKHIEYMQQHIGEAFEGVISGITNWGIYIELPNTIEGMVSLANMKDDYYVFDAERMVLTGEKKHKTYVLGQKLYIEVVNADKLLKTIDFAIIGEKRYKTLTENSRDNG